MNKRWCIFLLTLGLLLALSCGTALAGPYLAAPQVEAPDSAVLGEDYTVTITEPVPNAENYQLIIFNTDWEPLVDSISNGYPGTMTVPTDTLEPGDYYWWVGVWTGDELDRGGKTTGPLKIYLNAPVATTAQQTVVRGEYLTVAVEAPVYKAQYYGLHVINTHGSEEYDDWEWLDVHMEQRGYTDTLTISTARLEPGDYLWWCGVWTEGKPEFGNKDTGNITVLPPASSVSIHVSSQDVLTHERFLGNIVAPGAEAVRIFVNGDEHDCWEGEVFDADWLQYDEPGVYTFGASACFDGEWTSWEDCTVQVNITAPNGSLPDLHFSMPAEISSGQDLEITFDQLENVDYYVWFEEDHSRWAGDSFNEDVGHFEDGRFILYSGGLEPGLVYRVGLTVASDGFTDYRADGTVMVDYENFTTVDDPSSTLTMRLARTESYLHDVGGLHVTLYAPGAHGLKLYQLSGQGNWDETHYYEDHTGAHECLRWDEPGEYTIAVSAYYGEGDDGYWTDPAHCQYTIPVYDVIDALPVPAVTGAPVSVERGEYVTVELARTEHAENYDFAFYLPEDVSHELVWTGGQDGGSYTLSTATLEPGEYTWRCSMWAYGYQASEILGSFTVTAPAQPVNIHAATGSALVNEAFSANIVAPGAEAVRYYVNGSEHDYRDGEVFDANWLSYNEEGDYTLGASACFNGEWTAWEDCTVQVSLTADHVYDESYIRGRVPATLNAGEDFVISFPEGVFASWANVFDQTQWGDQVYWMNTNDEQYHLHDIDNPDETDDNYWENYDGPADSIAIPASYLKQGHEYSIDMGMWGGAGIQGSNVNGIRFAVLGSGRDEGLTLLVNGGQDDLHLNVYEPYTVQVIAPGACAVRVHNGDGWDYRTGDNLSFGWWQEENEGEKVLVAEACYEDRSWDDVNWDEWDWGRSGLVWGEPSNRVTLFTSAQARLDRPEAQVMNSPVNKGDFLEIKVTNYDADARYSASIWWPDGDGNEMWPLDWFDNSGDTIQIPTVDIPDLGEWYVRVRAYGKAGFLDNYIAEDLIFTLNDSSDCALSFSKYDVLTHERFLNAMRAPGAVRITTTVNEPDGWNINEDSWDDVWVFGPWNSETTRGDALRFSDSGEYTVKLYAQYGDGLWQDTGVSKTVRVTALYDRLPDPEVIYAGLAQVDEDYSFTVRAEEGKIYYNVDVVWDGDWDHPLLSDHTSSTGETAFTLDRKYVDMPDTFFIRVWYWSDDDAMAGYEGSTGGYLERCFFSVDHPNSSLVTLTASATEALLNEYVHITVSAPGAERIRLINRGGEFDQREETFFEFDSDTDDMIFAQAQFDGEWYSSEPLFINRIDYGQCGASAYTLSASAVTQGEELTVTAEEAENAIYYDLHVVRAEDGNDQVYYARMNVPGTYELPTALEPGGYYAYVSTAGMGYSWNDEGPQEHGFFTIEPGEKYLRTDRNEAETLETVRVKVFDPEAQRIRVSQDYLGENEPNWRNEDGEEGKLFAFDLSWNDTPRTVTIRAEGWHDEGWVEIGSVSVTVSAPHGQLGEPIISAAEAQILNDGLAFSIEMPENAAKYDVEVWKWTDEFGGREWLLAEYGLEENQAYHLDAEQLNLGETYVVFARAMGYGYECHEITVDVVMVETTDAPEFIIPTTAYVIDAGRMSPKASMNGQPLERFLLDLQSPSSRWTEYWCVYDESYGWNDHSTPFFPWGTEEEGPWQLRVALCDENGVQTSAWSYWQAFEAFRLDVDNLTTLRLPDSLTAIGDDAFQGISAEKVIIPAGVTSIGARAFADCGNLKLVVFDGDGEISIADDAFANCPNLVMAAFDQTPVWHRLFGSWNVMTR